MTACREANRSQLERFVEALFRYAAEGTFASLRSFTHRQGKAPAQIEAVKLNGHGLEELVTAAHRRATWAANYREPLVFAPPIATFTSKVRATEADLAQGLAISVEVDERPATAVEALVSALGIPTVIMASGGTWTDPETGEVQAKQHIHYRLRTPTTDAAGHAKLKRARRLAALLTGADPTTVPSVHPLRWAGSLHRKDPDSPKEARIIGGDADAEVDLDEALAALEEACRVAGLDPDKVTTRGSGGGERQEARDTSALVQRIISGTEYLGPLVALSARYAAAGMSRRQIVETLRGFLEAVPNAVRDLKDGHPVKGRWQDRWNSIDRMATSAVAKFGPAAKAPPPEADAKPDHADRPERKGTKPDEPELERHQDGRALVRLIEEHVNDTARRCARLLDDDLFLRGSLPAVLVRVEEVASRDGAEDPDDEIVVGGVRHARGSLILVEPTPERMQYRLDALTLFQRYDARQGKWVPKSCPTAFARRIIGAAAELGFRPCTGIVAVPLFVRGEIVATSGYHHPSGCIVELAGELPGIPARPTKADATKALGKLLRPFRGYIGGRPKDQRRRTQAAFAAAALTAILRPSLRAAPAILLDANVAGAGKGKAARALAVIATGRHPAVITEGHSEQETEKRLAAAILSGTSAMLLDNVQRELASSTLESGLTEGIATIRPFGKLTDVTVPCSALVIITANNAALRADMLRRTLPVRIVADTDQPELRRFDFDPYEEAKRHRLAIIAAGLTVARAWHLARDSDDNQRIRETTLGSFEQWADMVAGAVEWLTGVNPITLIEERKKQDPRRGDDQAVIEALAEWQANLKGAGGQARRWWYAKEAAAAIDAELWTSVILAKADKVSSKQVGRWLTARRDKVFGDRQLSGELDRKGVMTWTLRGLPGLPGSAGFADTSRARNGGDEAANPTKGSRDKPGDIRQTRQMDDAQPEAFGWEAEL